MAIMDIKFQLIGCQVSTYDLSQPSRDKSHGWFFFFTTLIPKKPEFILEVNASQNRD